MTRTESPDAPRPARRALSAVWGLRSLLAFLEERGADVEAVRREAGLRSQDVEDPDHRVDSVAAFRAWEVALALTGEDDLGLLVAAAQPAGSIDILEYAFRASPSLRRGFEQLVRFRRVVRDDLVVAITDEGPRVAVAFTLAGRVPLLRQQASYFLYTWLRLARDATGRRDLTPLETRMHHARPARDDRTERAFGGPVRYGCSESALEFDRDAMALPMMRPDPGLLGVLIRRLSRLEPGPEGEAGVVAAVRSRLAADLAAGNVTAARLAEELGMSARTLDRRLRAEGTSFRAVLDGYRRELAERLLRERRVSLGEAAFLLGFSDPSAFHRSFKRWTGLTPHAFRRSVV